MAIERYERQEKTDERTPQVDFSGGEIKSPGNELRSLGRSLLETAEPAMKARAVEAGTKAGAQAPLMRDVEDNILRRADVPREGGLVYGEAYKNAMNELYKGRLLTDAELVFEGIKLKNEDDPQQALIELQAHAEAVSATVPDDIKAEIEPALLREAVHQFNGLNSAKLQRDNRRALDGLEKLAIGRRNKTFKDLKILADKQDTEAYEALETEYRAFVKSNHEARMGIVGGLTQEGAEGEMLDIEADLMEINMQTMTSIAMLDVIRNSSQLDRGQLELIEQWGDGDQTEGEGRVFGQDYKKWVERFPTELGREEAARWATKELAQIDERERKEAAKAAENDAEIKAQEERNEIAVLGPMAMSNPKLFARYNADFNAKMLRVSPDIISYLGDEQNRVTTAAEISATGRLPTAVKEYILKQSRSNNIHNVVNLVSKFLPGRDERSGWYTGVQAWKDEIDGDTQALIIRYQEMADMEMPTEQRRAIYNDIITGKWRTRDIASSFKDDDGKPSLPLYHEMRDRYALAVFGRRVQTLPEGFAEQIDSATKSFIAVYGPDKESAVRNAVESVATLWTPSELGSQGFIPTELSGLHLSNSQLDKAFENWVPGKGHRYGGAGFTTLTRAKNGQRRLPRARLTFVDPSQLPAGVGNYRIDYYDIDGNHQGFSRYVNIDAVLSKHFGSQSAYYEATNKGRRESAKIRRDDARKALTKANQGYNKLAPIRRGRDY